MMRAIPWPSGCLVASLRRGGRMIIPDGRTILMAGNVLLIITEPSVQPQIEKLCSSD